MEGILLDATFSDIMRRYNYQDFPASENLGFTSRMSMIPLLKGLFSPSQVKRRKVAQVLTQPAIGIQNMSIEI